MATINQIFVGLEIFMNNGQYDTVICAEHDIIYGPQRDNMLLSVAELEILETEGWGVDSDTNCWIHYC